MIAPRRRTDPALPTTSRGPSSPTTTVGAIMLVSRLPGVAGPPATRSYSPSMLFRWMPVPGTITPEPEPVDAETDAAFPAASTAETCVVPADGAAGITGDQAPTHDPPAKASPSRIESYAD